MKIRLYLVSNSKKFSLDSLLKILIFLSLLILSTIELSCPIFYDYTSEKISCVSTCPSNSKQINKKCLRTDQYISSDNQVHLCQNGNTSNNRKLCCQKDQFILNDNQCIICNGNVFQNGKYCCSNNQYMNYAVILPQCTKISTGICTNINITSPFKICCPVGQFYHISDKKCVKQTNFNCDTNLKICCNLNQKLEYSHQDQQYLCVKNCRWHQTNSFQCQKYYCNSYNRSLSSSQSSLNYILSQSLQFIAKNQLFLSFKINSSTHCCYGVSTKNQCIKSQAECGKRFMNRGWSICCSYGLYYSIQLKACLQVCTGYLLFQILCIPNNTYLDLSGKQPKLSNSSLCNSLLTLPSQMPVCCPLNFYLDNKQGCKYCSGTIHQISVSQICCLKDQYYDRTNGICIKCEGKLDKTGTLCCQQNRFIKYSIFGIASCTDTCFQDNIYNTEYCCDSLTNSQCVLNGFLPTKCNSQYFVVDACQICPKICFTPPLCTKDNQNISCSKICDKNSALITQIDTCLSCDVSCNRCILPFDNTGCISCSQGYTMANNICLKCFIECKTCMNSLQFCTSCYQDSMKPYLFNGKCVSVCQSGLYSNQTCQSCNFNCVQCNGRSNTQCTKCFNGFYLTSSTNGVCATCGGQCNQCFSNTQTCLSCKNGYKYYSNTKTCTQSCLFTQISFIYTNSSYQICYPCHSSCKFCSSYSQNCLTCIKTNSYVDDYLGVKLCIPCISPCFTCVSKDICSTCIDGYYLNASLCIICYQKCKTCLNGSENGCLSCIRQNQLVSGKCIGCSNICLKCDINQNCLQCQTNYSLYKGTCFSECPLSFYSQNKKCMPCYSQCKTCLNASQNGCTSCLQQQIQLIQGKCIGCSANCQNCSINLICSQCIDNYYLYQTNCVDECPSGSFKSNKICQNCPSQCQTCASVNNCITCKSTFPYLFQNQCINQCPTGYKPSNIQKTCVLQQKINSSNVIQSQKFIYQKEQSFGYLNIYFYKNATNEQINQVLPLIKFSLINLGQGITANLSTVLGQVDYVNKKAIYKVGPLYTSSVRDYDASLTSIQDINSANSNINTSFSYKHISTQLYSQLYVKEYTQTPFQNIKIIGIFVSIVLLIFGILSKFKSHFLAQQANSLILHFINFSQVIYLFKFISLHQNGTYGFLQGFGWSMLSFFPNFFQKFIPTGYVQITRHQSLIPDGNLIRNAGFVYSYEIIIIGLIIIGSLISYLIYRLSTKQSQIPQIRKIMRIGIYLFHIGFLPLLFFSFVQLIVPSKIQSQHKQFYLINIILSYLNIFMIILLMCGIFYHFYQTYNSDILQHYYTLRESAQYIEIFMQSLILCLSIGRSLISLTLIPLQLIWLAFNYHLYKYGQGYTIFDCLKIFICSGVIIIGYLILALSEIIIWPVIIVFLCISLVTLLFYSIYQQIGLYYYLFNPSNEKLQKSI